MRIVCSWLALSFVIALAGCPPPVTDVDAGVAADGDDAGLADEDAGVADAGPEALDVATFCSSFHAAVCAGFTSCGCTLEGRAFTAATCADLRASACVQALGEAVPFVATGDVVIDPVGSTACFDAVAALVADCRIVDATTLPAACAVVLLDRAGLGEGCTLSSTPALCADGAGLCAGPTCAPLPVDGDACAGGVLCAAGLACVDGTCGAPPAPVPPAEAGADCVVTADCAVGLSCVADQCAPGPARGSSCGGPTCASGDACVRDYGSRVCAALAAVGEPCAGGGCEAGLFCDVDACAPLPGDGEACTPNLECAPPTLCDADNGLVCVVPPGEGEACLVGSALCAIGLGCNVDNVCAAGPGVGEACLIPNNLCAGGLACDFTAEGSFCAERRGPGGVCQNDVVCGDGLFCNDGACGPTLAIGEACPTGGGCAASDECNDLGVGGFTCQPRPDELGEVCLESCEALACEGLGGACAPGLCASP